MKKSIFSFPAITAAALALGLLSSPTYAMAAVLSPDEKSKTQKLQPLTPTELSQHSKHKISTTYTVKYLDYNTNKNLGEITKTGSIGDLINENAITKPGYTLISTETKKLVLKGNDQIVFYYLPLYQPISQKSAPSISQQKTPTTYTVKHLDFNTNKKLSETVKEGFIGETITEHAIKNPDYVLITRGKKEVTLKGKDQIVFYYLSNGLAPLKQEKIKAINNFTYKDHIGEDIIQETIKKIENATTAKEVNKIFDEIKEKDKPRYLSTQLRIKYIDAQTGRELIPAVTQKAWYETIMEITAPEIAGYLPSKDLQTVTIDNKEMNEAVFHYVRPHDDIPFKDFVKEKINIRIPIVYQNTDFTGRYEALKEYILKQIYVRNKVTHIVSTENDMAEMKYHLIDMPISASYVRHARNINYSVVEKLPDGKNLYKVTFTYFVPGYLITDEDIEKAEDIIDAFVKTRISPSMSDYSKAYAIYKYLIDHGKAQVNKKGETIPQTPSGKSAYAASTLLTEGSGVCEAWAVAYARIAERVGLDHIYMSAIYHPGFENSKTRNSFWDYYQKSLNRYKSRKKITSFNHAMNQVKINGTWYNLDVYAGEYIASRYGNKSPMIRLYFLKSDEHFEHGFYARMWIKELTHSVPESYQKRY